ncbi:hypothetical protein ACTXT7_015896, partial [Hymenolepis weldensis]
GIAEHTQSHPSPLEKRRSKLILEHYRIWKRHLVDFNNGWALAFLHLSDETGFPKRVVLCLRDVGIPDRVSYKGGAKFKLIDAFTAEDVIIVNSTEPFEVRINPSGIVMLIVEPIS